MSTAFKGLFGGGTEANAPLPSKVQTPQLPATPAPIVLQAPPSPTPISPAPTASSQSVVQSAEDQKRQAARRQGISSTILAGDNNTTGVGTSSILG